MQVGLALLLIALVVSIALLILVAIVQTVVRAREAGRRFDRLTRVLDAERSGAERRFAHARARIGETTLRVADLERRLSTQEPE